MPPLLAVFVGLFLALQQSSSATYITAAESAETLRDSMARSVIDQSMKGADVPGGRVSVAMLHRSRPETSALVHERVTEIYQILEGSGTLATGGSLKAPTPIDLARVGAGPSQQGAAQGGESRRVGPKDIVIIPAGTPHGFTELDGSISYLVYRFEPVQGTAGK